MSNKKTFTLEALHGYVAPSVSVLACQNEGILCASYGEAGAAGKILTEENSWDM